MDLRAHAPYQVGSGDQRAAGGDQVIEHQHRVALAQAVGMDFEEGFAVFGLVALGQYVRWQFALLAKQDQRFVQLVGNDRTDQEAPGIHGADVAEVFFDIALGETVGHQAQGPWRLEQGGDVAEDHARLREVDDGADQGFDVEGIEGHLQVSWRAK